METLPELYPLTGLQIGDIQSYVSPTSLYFPPSSRRLLILVDNRPWLINKLSRSAKLWQFMVTKYRMSPFVNTRTLHKISNPQGKSERNNDKSKRSYRWLPAIDSAKWQEKFLLSYMDLCNTLHGFIIFEVAWKDVHGINYVNELQTDTYLALEVKSMKKWEFNSPEQAERCLHLWFSGRASEVQSLKNTLQKLTPLDTQHWDIQSSSKDIFLHKRSSSDAFSDDDFLDVLESPFGIDDEISVREQCRKEGMKHEKKYCFDQSLVQLRGICKEKRPVGCTEMEDETTIAPAQYAGTLILVKFRDSILPFKLRQIIMSDLRLLTLLEAGLPSWVIFFQSYPLFCHFYRPWMRHLVRSLYILMSLVTVIIGFYDLYKNVPLLKATAARLCGPLFGWIEDWDMVSRIRYLGTMLFLQNLEKGFKWFRMLARSTRVILTTIAKPLSGPFSEVAQFILPLWNACSETGEMFSSMMWFMILSMYELFLDLIEVLIWPFELLYSYIWSTAASVHLFLCTIWDLFLVPIRCVLTLANYTASLLCSTLDLVKDVWESASGIFQLKTLSEVKQDAYDISLWRGLWDDLFSQVFRATRSIINILAAFLMTCNRHRLSIYNHVWAFLQRLARLLRLTPETCRCRQIPHTEDSQEIHRECDRCK